MKNERDLNTLCKVQTVCEAVAGAHVAVVCEEAIAMAFADDRNVTFCHNGRHYCVQRGDIVDHVLTKGQVPNPNNQAGEAES